MGKVSPVSSKYIVHTHIVIEGVVDRPDVIGAVFGQTEGLLGNELELRELQRSGKIGRIEVNLETRSGKTNGDILIPSSLDKAETAIIAASLETIQRIGPCNAKVKVLKIEDVRISKRKYVIERAKELLRVLTDSVLPDSQEITEEVAHSVSMMEITEYGKDRLACGPAIDDSEEVIVVEGRADVLNLLKQGIKNSISMNGTSVPETIKELSKRKVITAFVDGDRGGDLIIKELLDTCEIDFAIKAPDGKEVEEITKKEIHKALRSKVAIEQFKVDLLEIEKEKLNRNNRRQIREPVRVSSGRGDYRQQQYMRNRTPKLNKNESGVFRGMLDDLIGTRGAYILDKESKILGKVPTSELATTISNLRGGVHALVFDGTVDKELVSVAERSGVRYLVGMDTKVKTNESRVGIITSAEV